MGEAILILDDTCACEQHAQHIAFGVANLAREICGLIPPAVGVPRRSTGMAFKPVRVTFTSG